MTRPCDQLGPFLEGELPEAEAAASREHRAGCPDCPARLDSALQLAGLAAAAKAQPAAQPQEEEKKEPRPRFQPPRWARRAAAAAALVAASVLAVAFAPGPERAWYPDAQDRFIEGRLGRAGGRYHPYEGGWHGPGTAGAPGALPYPLPQITG